MLCHRKVKKWSIMKKKSECHHVILCDLQVCICLSLWVSAVSVLRQLRLSLMLLPSSVNWEESSNYSLSTFGQEWMEIRSWELREAFTFVSWSSCCWEASSPFFSAKVMHDVLKKSSITNMQLCMENYHQSFNPTSSSIRSEPIFTRQLLLQYVSVNLLRNERRYLALVTQNPDTARPHGWSVQFWTQILKKSWLLADSFFADSWKNWWCWLLIICFVHVVIFKDLPQNVTVNSLNELG